MKSIELSLNNLSKRLFSEGLLKISSKNFYTIIANVSFFFIITAQMFWSSIHGDGAVYSWLIREISEGGVLKSQLPNWTQTQVFAEHPYLFFYFGTILTKFIGYSDLAIKIPNYIVAALSIFVVYKISCLRHVSKSYAHSIGLIAGYVLILNATYIMQVSQPSLDPLAQLLAIIATLILIFYRQVFYAGLLLGLAFLTKGLELLPNLAAFIILGCYLNRQNVNQFFKEALIFVIGLVIPILIWLGIDFFVWKSQWLYTYWNRQFTNRFFREDNMKSIFDFGYFLTFIKVYFFEIIILSIGIIKSKKWLRRSDSFFIYFMSYLFFNILAFLIIKKNSSQHLTGVLLFGSIFVAEYLWEIWHIFQWKFLRSIPIILFITSMTYWCWFTLHGSRNPDFWTAIKNESTFFSMQENKIPIVIKENEPESYGLFYTSQWYLQANKVYFQSEADQLLIGQKVFLLSNTSDGKLSKIGVIYKRGLLE